MNSKAKFLVALLSLTAIIVIYLFVSSPLPRLARRIANADSIVVTISHSPVSIPITGEDVKRVIQAVSFAKRERPPWGMTDSCIYDVKVTFFSGTNPVGKIVSCTSLFMVNGKKYRDDTGVLGAVAVAPICEAYVEWGRKQTESKDRVTSP